MSSENKEDDQDTQAEATVDKVHRLKGVKDGQYSNPVYKKLSVINGEINRMTRDEVRQKLEDLGLESSGVTDVMKKRLKTHYRQKKLSKAHVSPPKKANVDYLMVIDYEATCEADNEHYKHEIIEFPVILVNYENKQVVDEFHSYVKPRINPQLSEFCVQLTGITQDKVDEAMEFPVVLSQMETWMKSHGYGDGKKFAVVTDGPWDMSRFLYMQCRHNKLSFPRWARRWINLRKSYSNFYQCRRTKLNEMLKSLGMTFEGHLHSGLDDSRNIARIAIRLLEDGCELKINEYLYFDKNENAFNAKHISQEEQSTDATDEDLEKSLNDLDIAKDPDSEVTENLDDLLEYYRIQKT